VGVERKAEAADIGAVQSNADAGARDVNGRATITEGLGEPGDARTHAVAVAIIRNDVLVQLAAGEHADGMRSRPDQRHVPAYHVPELRQFVEIASTQESANARNARIIVDRLADAARVAEIGVHRAKLKDAETAVEVADAFLREERGAWRFQLDRDGNQQD